MRISSKLRSLEGGGLMFWCPGCDGNPDAPTFTPSILVKGTLPITDEERDRIMAGETFRPVPFVCHSFVTNGRIQFLGDCTHVLAGQTVDLPDFET